MFRRVFLSALVAGVLGGVVISAVQSVTTTPLILHAETFETASAAHAAPAPPAATGSSRLAVHDHAGHDHAAPDHAAHDHGDGWAPADGIERLFYTTMANILVGFGFALLIAGGFALSGRQVDAGEGVLWGIAGFAVFTLAPGLGLPPELPGTAAAELVARQGWWLLTVAATAAGLALIVFRGSILGTVLGLLVIVFPHVLGAPHPHELTNAVPAELGAQFAAASIVTSAAFWVLLGWLTGTGYNRLGAIDAIGLARAATE